jgi:nitroimidazol reductase NimA-like FMN-containing flavoprotein (pyridoxamine 5'-phosphate oxidase superfamily)
MTELRRKEKEITDKIEIEKILKSTYVGRLGTSKENIPYVVPVSFVYYNGKIIFHGARKGMKMDNIRSNPQVCFEVDTSEIIISDNPCNYSFKYNSVIANGRAKILEDPREKLRELRRLTDKYAPGKGKRIEEEHVNENLSVVKITIHKMKGKKSPV